MGRRARASRAGQKRRRLARAVELLPVALLLAVALNQLWLAHRTALPAWSGGGFGMFASADAWARRHIHVWALGPGTRRELDLARIPEARALKPQLHRLLGHPTKARLRAMALRVAALPIYDGGPVEGIAIAVFATRFDPETLAPSGELVRGIEVSLDGR